MTRRRTIALVAGGIVTVAAFLTALYLLVFGGMFQSHERLIMVSIAVGPVAMLSVMVGYAVWWIFMFVMTLMSPREDDGSDS
jgi:hypothetical protein